MYSSEEQRTLVQITKMYLTNESPKKNQVLEDQVIDLRKLIAFHEYRYYMLNSPLISDYEYDQLFKQLEHIEADHPHLLRPDSPTQRVSDDLTSDFPSVAHLTPMLSLANSYNAEDLKDWDEQLKRLWNIPEHVDIEYAVEPKFDGGSIALVFEDNMLTRGATRGNGTLGEEMTNNARVIRSIPLRAAFSDVGLFRVELRGEVVIRKDNFEKINQQRAKDGLSLFANARNTATGGLRMKDPKEVAKRGMEAFVYTLGFAQDKDGTEAINQFKTHYESLDLLHNLGFKVPLDGTERKLCNNISAVIEFCESWEKRREAYPYEVDGMVVKVNDRVLQERAGYTAHHPRWAMAYKFKAKQATSKLLQVTYQVGKVGSITPVAKVEPVQLAGVTVSSVSLHNEDFITSKDLRIGDTVLVERAGDVIPYIVKAMDDVRDGSEEPIVFPVNCPINDTDNPVELVREGGEAAWRCSSCVCGVQDLQKVIFHVSKSAMDIEGLGKSIVERFYDLGLLRNISDVYQLDYDQIRTLEGFGEKSVENLKLSIDKAKHNPIHRLLHSLSIHHLGKKVSKLLSAELDHVLDLAEWNLDDFTCIKDVGPVVAENVILYFSKPEHIAMLKKMESLGVNLTQTEDDRPKAQVTEGPFVGKTILFTGSLQTMSRKEAQAKAEAAGAKNISAVSSNLNILVVGEKAGSKLRKAEALGTVNIMTEEAFLALL